MELKPYNKYIIIIIFSLLSFLGFLLIKPFIGVITFALLLGYVFYPLFKKFNNRIIKKKNIASFIFSLFLLIIIILPSLFLLNTLAKEATVFYVVVKQKLVSIYSPEGKISDTIINEILADPKKAFYVQEFTQKLTKAITNSISNFIFSLPKRIIDFFLLFFILFYVFKNGNAYAKRIKELLPFEKERKDYLVKRFKGIIDALVYGYVIIALIEGFLGGLIFYLLGIPNPVLFGILMAFLSFLPFIGPTVVWVPASLIFIFNGFTSNSNVLLIKGIILLLYGFFVMTTIDNLLKPRIVGARAKVNPVIIFIGILGGIYLMGGSGIILGPLALVILISLFEAYSKKNET